jgi:hypothetical protein
VLSRKDLFLLSLLTFFWGINWPVMKYAVLTYPPMAFRGISMVLGILAIGLYMMLRKDHFYVPPQERGPILKLVIGNMLIWHLFAMYAIKFLTSGRAAIIGYTMPVWAMLIGVLFYKNPLTWRGAVGVLLALIAFSNRGIQLTYRATPGARDDADRRYRLGAGNSDDESHAANHLKCLADLLDDGGHCGSGRLGQRSAGNRSMACPDPKRVGHDSLQRLAGVWLLPHHLVSACTKAAAHCQQPIDHADSGVRRVQRRLGPQ